MVNVRLGTLLMSVSIALVSTACLGAIPSFTEVKGSWRSSEAKVLDRNGLLVYQFRGDKSVRKLEWMNLSEISSPLKEAVIAGEDQRFYQHQGVDLLALGRSLISLTSGKRARGASTISMQVASLLVDGLKPRKNRRSFAQKFDQIREAKELEQSWTKDQILEVYLNLVYFRGELQGVGAASQALFSKEPSGLGREEALVLASLIRAPGADFLKVKERACALSRRLEWASSCEEVGRFFSSKSISVAGFRSSTGAVQLANELGAKHLSRLLTFDSQTAKTTIEYSLQKRVFEILRSEVLRNREKNLNDMSAIVLDNQTGQVLAYVGGVGALASASEVDGVQAKRQAGSTLKPFIYARAIERKYLTAASKLSDLSLDVSVGESVYQPTNADREFHGESIDLRNALASSLNLPAVRVLQMITVPGFVSLLGRLGFTGLQEQEYYGPSLALGAADVSLFDLTNAYRTLANGGTWSAPVYQLDQVAHSQLGQATSSRRPARVFSKESVFIVNDILSDSIGRGLTFGLDTPMNLPFWSAAKTGTSKDMRDNWCVGFTSRFTVGVWAGNLSGQAMWNVTGVSGAAPAWSEIVQSLHLAPQFRGRDRTPVSPDKVVKKSGEWFISGTEPSEGTEVALRPMKITYPASGMIIAIDPDIPAKNQRVFFTANVSRADRFWQIDGEQLAAAVKPAPWRPNRVGTHTLKLVDSIKQTIDEVQFSVRGQEQR